MLVRVLLKLVLLLGLIVSSNKNLMSESALEGIGQDLVRGADLTLRATGQHYGFCLPYASSLVLLVMRNQYKLAVLI